MTNMSKRILCLLIANLFAAAPAFAQSDFRMQGSVGLGGIGVDDKDSKDASYLNEYRDMSNGVLSIFDIRGRSSTYWLELFGENLGRDDQYINLRGGRYELFKYRIYSDSLKHNLAFGGITPYSGAGSNNQTATFPALNTATWQQLGDVGYKRRDTGGFAEFQGLSPWYFRVDGNQVKTSGSKIGASSLGLSPVNGLVELSLPVEYTTRTAIVEGGYATKTASFAVSWTTSKYENDQEKVDWTNPFYSNGKDTTYLGSDTDYSRILVNGTLRQLPLSTTVAIRYTKDETETDTILGTTVLHTGGAVLPTGASSPVFNGRVDNETFSLGIASTPMKNLDTRIYWNEYERKDGSTHLTFNNPAVTTTVYENHILNFDKSNYGIDAYYRFDRANRIGAGWDYLDTKRDRFDFDRTKDRKWFVEWKSSMIEDVGFRVKYINLDRKSDFLLGNDGANANDVAYWNRFLKAYDAADLDRDEWKLNLDFSPVPFLDLSFEGNIKRNDYTDQVLGRLSDDRTEYYVSASYGNPDGVRFTVFGDWENIEYKSYHRVVGSSTATTPPGPYDPFRPPTSSNYNWEGKNKDKNYAYGLSLDWKATDKLKVSASAMMYKTDGSVDFASQTGPTAPPIPITAYDDSRRRSLNLKGVYDVSKAWSVTGGYAYEKYDYSDAQYDGYRYTIPASSNQNSYYNGFYSNPKYKANIIYGLVTFRF
jgi:MtrB/PioB family decaheme-associated outer membrane protein